MADRIKELVLKLREVDQTRKELLQEISHDLKTPLSSLLMSFDSIERRPDMTADKKNELLQEARGETEYISILLDDLLFLSVVEDPAFHIHPSNFNFSELVEEVIKLAQQKFPHIQVNLELTPSLKLNADSVLIKRALRNLIENSFSFCIQKIQIKLSQNSLEIIDDGPGFHPEILENFGKKRLNTVRISDESGQRKSTGLGAVIANRILKHHHFDLLASNEISDNKQISGAKLLIKFS
jgi:K+-sensing histidine kinase KdpD